MGADGNLFHSWDFLLSNRSIWVSSGINCRFCTVGWTADHNHQALLKCSKCSTLRDRISGVAGCTQLTTPDFEETLAGLKTLNYLVPWSNLQLSLTFVRLMLIQIDEEQTMKNENVDSIWILLNTLFFCGLYQPSLSAALLLISIIHQPSYILRVNLVCLLHPFTSFYLDLMKLKRWSRHHRHD